MDPGETTTTLEWTVHDLKHLFDSSEGETKSEVIKSETFGGGRWQCLFYANSGIDGGTYVSCYISCQPTVHEKESAVDGKWVREGLVDFNVELRDVVGKSILMNTKEAKTHFFSYLSPNWGWAQFARRDALYYQSDVAKNDDAFLIICTVTVSPTPPPSAP